MPPMGLKVYDISPLISCQIAVFPGDQPFSVNSSMDFSKEDHLTLSSIATTVHLGAHADGPIHYHPDGVGIDERDLSLYMGRCQVIQVPTRMGERISLQDLAQHKISATRILFRTDSFMNPNEWQHDFMSIDADVIEYLAEQKVRLVGIDTPSVDPSICKQLLAHKKIYECNMAILEGLVLSDIKDGVYTLLALPLKLKGLDASPVRAVLISPESDLRQN